MMQDWPVLSLVTFLPLAGVLFILSVRGTDEAREGFDAFLSKRPAAWIPPAP